MILFSSSFLRGVILINKLLRFSVREVQHWFTSFKCKILPHISVVHLQFNTLDFGISNLFLWVSDFWTAVIVDYLISLLLIPYYDLRDVCRSYVFMIHSCKNKIYYSPAVSGNSSCFFNELLITVLSHESIVH